MRRSEAEQEIRSCVVDRLRKMRPNARIIHEINVGGGINRVDVMAVDIAEIISVEIKSKKDKLERAPAQIKSMLNCSHHVAIAFHEKFLVEKKTNQHAAHYELDGSFFLRSVPSECRGATPWVYPIKQRSANPKYDRMSKWLDFDQCIQQPLPDDAVHLLWRDELYNLCCNLKLPLPKRARMPTMVTALRWNATGSQITKGICSALRMRNCHEADKPITRP